MSIIECNAVFKVTLKLLIEGRKFKLNWAF